ncbi:MAG: double-strand break repair helicase AddA [Hyphomonadaceae bacterium]
MSAPDPTTWPEYQAALKGQALAALPEVSAWVAANAGSGKTKVLIDRVARLLLRGAKPDSILCVTYTKAAASEMQDRLFERLGAWCVMDAAEVCKQLGDLEDRDAASYSDEEMARARELFAQALETPGGLRIETIHAFCGRLLRRFPLEAGVAPGFRELDDDESGDLWSAALRGLGARIMKGAPELQAAARLAVEAGDGFGALASLQPRRELIETWVRACGGETKAVERLQKITGAGEETEAEIIVRAMTDDLPALELRAVLGALPTDKPTDASLARTLEFILSDASPEGRFDAWVRIARTKEGEPRKSNAFTKDATKVSPGVAALFEVKETPEGSEIQRVERTLAALSARRIFERSAALLRLTDAVFADYRRRKRLRAGLDFDDLIDVTSALLTRRAMAEWVLWKLDGGVSHILLDEAQDTSPGQWKILRALTEDIFAGQGVERETPRTFFVVGDQKQSIYSFQGADPEYFLEVAQSFHGRAVAAEVKYEMPELAMSFRSAPEVLRYVDRVFDPDHYDGGTPFSVRPPSHADQPLHTPFRKDHSGLIELWPLEPKEEEPESSPWDAPLDLANPSSPKARLADRIARFIRAEIDAGSAVWTRHGQRPCTPGDFLILVRGRKGGLFDAVLQALKRERLPVAGADRLALLDSLPVQDLLNLVRFALCPEDDLTLAEIIKGPFGRWDDPSDAWLDDSDLIALAPGRKDTLWRTLLANGDARYARLKTFLSDALARRFQPPFEFLTHALERGTGLPAAGWELILSRFGGPAREPVSALLDRAAGYDLEAPASLERFLFDIERRGGEVKRELSGPQDEVRVMTVHGAKGLEAPIVILPDTSSAPRYDQNGVFIVNRERDEANAGAPLWPGRKENDIALTAELRAEASARDLREHRRLLYVALTRARDRLVVCGAWNGSSKEGRHAESWYATCERAMDRMIDDGDALVDERPGGDLPVRRHGDRPPRLPPQETANAALTKPHWLAAQAPPEAVPARLLSPSMLGGDEPPPLAPFGPDREARLRRGRLIHTLFEALPELAPDERGEAARRFLARQANLDDAQREEMLSAVLRVLDDPDFAAVFAPGGHAESPVIGRLGRDIVNGRVDRLVVSDHEILIVDYKTDRPAPPDLSGVARAYKAQLAAYRAVLSDAWPGRRVRCMLVWIDGPKLMEIPPEELGQALGTLRP